MLNLSQSEVTCEHSLSGQPRNTPPPSTATLPRIGRETGEVWPKAHTPQLPRPLRFPAPPGTRFRLCGLANRAALPAAARCRPWVSASRHAHARASVSRGPLRSPGRQHLSHQARRVPSRPVQAAQALASGSLPPPAAGPAKQGHGGSAPRSLSSIAAARGFRFRRVLCVAPRGGGEGRRKEGGSAPAAPRPALRDPEWGR